MKRILVTALCCVCISGFLLSQNVFVKGDKVIDLSVGLGSYLTLTGGSTTIPPLTAAFEVCVKDNLFNEKSSLGIGGLLSYSSSKWESYYMGTYGWKYTDFLIGGRGVLHYQFVEKLDTYTGILLGFNIASSKTYGTYDPSYGSQDSSGGLVYGAFVGARYYFTDQFAVLAELGYGIAVLNLGISYKF